MQGGLPPAGLAGGARVEIACDESGFSGTNLLDPATPVITHASVDLSRAEAGELVAELRARFRLAPDELKSGPFLRRPAAGDALTWLRAALHDRAHVQLIDKELFLVTRIVDLFLTEPTYAAGTRLAAARRPAAIALYRSGRTTAQWPAFLAAFTGLARTKRRLSCVQSADRFEAARKALLRAGVDGPAAAVLAELTPDRVRATTRRLDADDRAIPPPLEPLLPALAETVLFWSGGRRQVLVTHDEQSALTADRLTRLRQALAGAGPPGVSPLAGLVMADSRADPRIQVADLLAGVARRRGLP